jgi:mRNA interferase RelE/StbE
VLAKNPWHPSLRTKRIKGSSEFEVSVNMDIRMAIKFSGDTIILLLDVDHHDKLLDRRNRI